ncbi:E3 ubiquitin-protein ligase CBL-C isoform X2 [Denticeps clupeoides]|uniref:E3 ubiquitin-protein ligase CBL-C isoform X2 n=1 Tax=Denticeps clupeoides TaxID=299321 RepID=UPI0010A3F052|nr:E3 ubiquitin-protein ligase CBL-like isoform X2 [Denticeps clupeoides]
MATGTLDPRAEPSGSRPQPPTCADRKALEKTLRKLEKLHRLCTDPRLGLKNSPPYLPELVTATATFLMDVWAPYRGPVVGIPCNDEGEYLRIHIRHLLDKTKRAVLLFKEGKDKLFNEASNYRRNLTKLSLLFSHMLCEIRALFPGGHFKGDTYRLKKSEAHEFWKETFGNRCIVKWSTFKQQLRKVQSFEEGMEAMALKSTLDLTCNDHISVFEFDVFTKLFQPWAMLLRNWNQLAVTHPGYMAFLTYDQVKARLEHYLHRPGSYIFRLSCTQMGQWAIGHVTSDGSIVQTIPQNIPLYQALQQGFRDGCYLYPDGRDVNPDLSSLCETSHKSKVTVTEEQYDLYCEIGSTFQLCKICTERDKDTRIQPCGHLLCHLCLSGWQKSDGHTCPYCRCDIRGTESIFIEPYLPKKGTSAALSLHDGEDEEDDDEEDDDEDDHEDVELVIKELASFRKDLQIPPSFLMPPPLPPKQSTSSPSPSPRPPPQHSGTDTLASQSFPWSIAREAHLDTPSMHKKSFLISHRDESSSSDEETRSWMLPQLYSEESSSKQNRPSSSQAGKSSRAPWITLSSTLPKWNGDTGKEERNKGPRKGRTSHREQNMS